MDCDGALVFIRDDGSQIVAVYVGESETDRYSFRYTYKLDASGNYVLGSSWYAK